MLKIEKKNHEKNCNIFSYFRSKHILWVYVRAEAVLTRTPAQSVLEQKYVYPCKPQFCYIKVGYKRVFITQTCFPGVKGLSFEIKYLFSHLFVSEKRHKQAKIRKRRNQKKTPTPKTEVGKNQTNNQAPTP